VDSLSAVESATALRRTPLFDQHVSAGARLVPFAGWEMPVQYAGVKEEHLAVRSECGVFDVSHMGEIETSGPGALGLLQRLLSNDVAKIEVGGAQYSVLCREDGGILDDLFTYRLGDDRFLTVTNAANHTKDLAWFERHAREFECEVGDRLEAYAMLAVQGPSARAIVAELAGAELPPRMRAEPVPFGGELQGVQALVCGTGYTGEGGVEVLIAPEAAPALWDALLDRGGVPAGLAARDTLRTEVYEQLIPLLPSGIANALRQSLKTDCSILKIQGDCPTVGLSVVAGGPADILENEKEHYIPLRVEEFRPFL
jgi:aminomethyltransferase